MRYGHASTIATAHGLALFACAGASGQVTYYNGPFSTGTLTGSGIPAPPGTVWSELQADSPACANAIPGFSAANLGVNSGFRLADDYVVVPPDQKVIKICIFEEAPGSPPIAPLVTEATLQIWNGRPGDVTSSVIFGDTTTNRLLSQTFYGMYRILNTTTPPPGTPPDTTRAVFKIDIDVNPAGLSLSPGTYWFDWSTTMPGNVNHFTVPLTVPGVRSQPGWNARQFNVTTSIWSDLSDPGDPGTCADANVDLAWYIVYYPPECPANCDGSTTVPILNANDFQCFLNKFAAGDPYANCDGSTTPPVLNANDFQCFLNEFAAGCS